MAGKHVRGLDSVEGELTPAFPGGRLDLAYNEGRAAGFGSGPDVNPHTTGPESVAWERGRFLSNNPEGQIQTCWAGASA